jgi:plastocyanin
MWLERPFVVGAVLAAAALALGAEPVRAETIHVTMEQIAYTPAQISAHVGDTIEWDNKDIVAHTATARDGAWDVTIAPNAKNGVVLKSQGTVEYYCRFHPNMVGQVTVKPRE